MSLSVIYCNTKLLVICFAYKEYHALFLSLRETYICMYVRLTFENFNALVTGFMIHHKENGEDLTVTVRTRKRQWEAVIHKMPYHTRWWHLLITWDKQSGIALYINGNFVMQRSYAKDAGKGVGPMDSSLASDSDDIVIGCPNGTTDFTKLLGKFGKFDFSHLAIWDKVLAQLDVRRAYQASISETKESKACCQQKYGKTYHK